MRIVSGDEMKDVDRITIQEYGISDELLMENAGFEFVQALLKEFKLSDGAKIAVLCGGGNNGGDGFVIARLLNRKGFKVKVYLFVKQEKLGGIALANFKRLYHYNIEVMEISSEEMFIQKKEELSCFNLLVDALLGIGFQGKPRGIIAKAIQYVNTLNIQVVSVDMPSGIDANGGQSEPLAVKARATYTMGALKYGLIDYPGKEYAGRVRVLDIGFPQEVIDRVKSSAYFLERELVKKIIPVRKPDSHKRNYGHLAVIGGMQGYQGAAIMASEAALRSGSGLVTMFFSPQVQFRKPDEVISRFLPVDSAGNIRTDEIEGIFDTYSALVVGPGLGVSDNALRLVEALIGSGKKIVIDADGINNLAKNPSILKNRRGNIVLTPHIGEMSRLCGIEKTEIKREKRKIARDFAEKNGVTLVLKDSVTVIATKEGKIYINNGGVPSLAKGGSGDVLSGIIGAFLARGLNEENASAAGVYMHTLCGSLAARKLHQESVLARDLIECLPCAFRLLENEDEKEI